MLPNGVYNPIPFFLMDASMDLSRVRYAGQSAPYLGTMAESGESKHCPDNQAADAFGRYEDNWKPQMVPPSGKVLPSIRG